MKSKAQKKHAKITKTNLHQALDWAFEIAMTKQLMPVSIEDLQFASDLLIAAMDTSCSKSRS